MRIKMLFYFLIDIPIFNKNCIGKIKCKKKPRENHEHFNELFLQKDYKYFKNKNCNYNHLQNNFFLGSNIESYQNNTCIQEQDFSKYNKCALRKKNKIGRHNTRFSKQKNNINNLDFKKNDFCFEVSEDFERLDDFHQKKNYSGIKKRYYHKYDSEEKTKKSKSKTNFDLASNTKKNCLERLKQKYFNKNFAFNSEYNENQPNIPKLENSTQRCFANSTFQLLFAINFFKEIIFEQMKSSVAQEIQNIFKAMACFDSKLYDICYKKLLTNQPFKKFKPNTNHDSHEFLTYILHIFKDELFHDKIAPWEIYFYDCTQCSSCNLFNKNEKFIFNSFLQIDITNKEMKNEIKDKLELFNKKYQQKMQKCTSEIVKKEQINPFVTPESIFFCHINRFNDNDFTMKSTNSLNIPENFIYNNKKWELYGFVAHYGYETNSGHYVAYIKKDEKWFCCNDNKIQYIEIINDYLYENKNAYICTFLCSE